jgi:pectate lyase
MAASGGYETTYAIRAGVGANVRSEGNVFKGITNPFDFGFSDAAACLESIGDLMTDCTGTTQPKGTAFKPPYPYTAEPTATLEAKIRAGAGVR